MSVRLFADGTTGTVAVYTDPELGDAPVTNPLANVSRIRFHSDLEYPRVVNVVDGSITLQAIAANITYRQTHFLFVHGLGFTPFVEGYADNGINNGIPLSGSVPIVRQSSDPYTNEAGFCRWLHLGATPTHVVIQEFSLSSDDASFGASTVTYRVYVTDTAV